LLSLHSKPQLLEPSFFGRPIHPGHKEATYIFYFVKVCQYAWKICPYSRGQDKLFSYKVI
jgi:hypothetical protein